MNQHKTGFNPPLHVKILLRVLFAICLLLLLLDFIVHRHISHPLENLPGFYPLYGFIGCVLLVILAKYLRKLVMRSKNYYPVDNNRNRESNESKVALSKDSVRGTHDTR